MDTYISGDYEGAISYFELAAVQAEKEFGKGHQKYATALSDLGSLYYSRGFYFKAEPLLIQALLIREKALGMEHEDYAESLSRLAWLYNELEDSIKAKKYYAAALRINENIPGKNHRNYSNSLNDYGVFLLSQGNYDQAEKYLLEALRIRNKYDKGFSQNNARLFRNLGELYKKEGDYAKSELHFHQALSILDKLLDKHPEYSMGIVPDYALLLISIGDLFGMQGDLSKAEHNFIEAMQITERTLGKENLSYARSLGSLANLYYAKDNSYERVEQLLKEKLSITEKLFGKEHAANADALEGIAKLSFLERNYNKAVPFLMESCKNRIHQIHKIFPTLSESERARFLERSEHNYHFLYSFAAVIKSQQPDVVAFAYDQQLVTKALLFNTNNKIQDNILNSNNNELIDLFRTWQDKKNFISRVYRMTKAEKQNRFIEESKLEEEIILLERQLSNKSALSMQAPDTNKFTWHDVRQRLKPNEAAIEMIRFRWLSKRVTDTVYYGAMIVTQFSELPEMVLLENGNELEGNFIKYYQNSITNQLKDERSYKYFWEKIAASPALNGIKKIYLSPDGIYNSININTLINPTSEKYVFDETDIQIVTSTRHLLVTKPELGTVSTASLIGHPDYALKIEESNKHQHELPRANTDSIKRSFANGEIRDLPGTKQEIEEVSEILFSKNIIVSKYLDQQATEEEVKRLESPDILHIATHGFFLKGSQTNMVPDVFAGFEARTLAENPTLKSGLLLAGAQQALNGIINADAEDGILTAYEAMNLHLDKTQLVILSACETGLGEIKNGEGVYGLQRAFQTAGANTIIMSLWKVSDDATQQLMNIFYQNWFETGNKHQAFRLTQETMKKKYNHPYYWGAFVLVGE